MRPSLQSAVRLIAPLCFAVLPFVRWGEDFRYSRLAWLALAIGVIWVTRPMRTVGPRTGTLLLAGLLAAFASWAFSGFSPVSAGSLAGWAVGLAAVYTLLQDERPLDYGITFGLSVGLASIYGMLQTAGFVSAPVDAYGERDAASVFGLSNFAAEVLVLAIPLTIWAGLHTKRKPLRLALWGAAALQTAYLLGTGSRAGWLGLAAVLVVLILSWRPANKRAFIGVGAAGLVVLVAFAALNIDRLNFVANDSSIVFRLEAWRSAFEMGTDHLLTGAGPGRFPAYVLEYASPDLIRVAPQYGRSVNHPHNEFMAAFAEMGILGAAWLLAAVALAGFALLRGRNPWALAAFAGAVTVSLFGFPLQQAPFWAVLGIALAVGMPLDNHREHPSRPLRFTFALTLLILAGFLAYLGVASSKSRLATAQLEAAHSARATDATKARALKARAVVNLRESMALWPYIPESYVNLASAVVSREQELEAIQKYLKLMPGDHLAWLNLARIYREAGKLAAAESTLERLLLRPRAPVDAYHRLAAMYVNTQRLDKARRVSQEGLLRFPGNVQLLVDAGDAFRLDGDHTRAIKFYEQALAKEKQEALIYLRAGLSAMAMEQYQRAETHLRHGLRLSDENPAFPLLLARLAWSSERPDEAKAQLREALKRDPALVNNLEKEAPELVSLMNELNRDG